MINSLKLSIPFVIKAIPEVKINGLWLSNKLINVFIHYIRQVLILWQLFQTITPQTCLHLLYWLKNYPHTRKDIRIINHPSNINNRIYLFFLTQHIYWKIYETTYSVQQDLFSLNLISMNFMIV